MDSKMELKELYVLAKDWFWQTDKGELVTEVTGYAFFIGGLLTKDYVSVGVGSMIAYGSQASRNIENKKVIRKQEREISAALEARLYARTELEGPERGQKGILSKKNEGGLIPFP